MSFDAIRKTFYVWLNLDLLRENSNEPIFDGYMVTSESKCAECRYRECTEVSDWT